MDIKEMKKAVIEGLESTFNEWVKQYEDDIDEEDKVNLELVKQSLISKLIDELKERNDVEFIYANLELYKDLYKAMFDEDDMEILKLSSIIVKAHNEWELR